MAYGLVGGVGDHGRHGTLITEEIVNAAKLDTAECIEIRQNNIEQVEKALLRAYKTGLEEIGLRQGDVPGRHGQVAQLRHAPTQRLRLLHRDQRRVRAVRRGGDFPH